MIGGMETERLKLKRYPRNMEKGKIDKRNFIKILKLLPLKDNVKRIQVI